MKPVLVSAGSPQIMRGSHEDVNQHVEALRQEFSGQSELAFYHAKLIVLIRREFQTQKHFACFQALWQAEADWLLKYLNARWLISAADTLADHSTDPVERALAVGVSMLSNTVKIYETEYRMTGAVPAHYLTEQVATVQGQLIPLFEGMSCFTVGTDDTLRNMVWRLKDTAPGTWSGRIAQELLNRFSQHDTAYGRLRQMHTRAKTRWWDE